jgi:hypothetical protein
MGTIIAIQQSPMKNSKPFLSVSSVALALSAMALSSPAADIVRDTWLDATRNDPASPIYSENGVDSDLDLDFESSWFNSGGTMTPSAGHLITTVPAGSASWTTYFAPEATPVSLAQGQQIRVTWVFTPTGINNGGAADAGLGFRTALANVGALERRTTDGSPLDSQYSGYRISFNVAPTLPATAIGLRERFAPGTAGNLLVNDSQWTTNMATAGTAGAEGMLNGTQYTYTFSLTRNEADGLDVAASITGGNINGTGSLLLAFTDPTPNGGNFDFDTFAMRPSSQAATANQFDTTLFRVELLTVPEPSTWALLGLAGLGLLLRRKRN